VTAIDRRTALAFGASATALALTGFRDARVADISPRLQTRLFNFRDDVSLQLAQDIVARLRAGAHAAGASGFLAGRNFNSVPFPTRFEWIAMIEFGAVGSAARGPLEQLTEDLKAHCRDQVECELAGPFPPGYANADGVKLRHTVMFDFRPDAPPDAQQRIVDAIRSMGRLPMVQAYRVEKSAAPAPAGERMEWQVIGDFASTADYKAYSDAPNHLAMRDDFRRHTARLAFLDVAL
jgi:hypothetical protein